ENLERLPYGSLIVDHEDLQGREHNRPRVDYGVTHRERVVQSVPPRSSRTTNVNVTPLPPPGMSAVPGASQVTSTIVVAFSSAASTNENWLFNFPAVVKCEISRLSRREVVTSGSPVTTMYRSRSVPSVSLPMTWPFEPAVTRGPCRQGSS